MSTGHSRVTRAARGTNPLQRCPSAQRQSWAAAQRPGSRSATPAERAAQGQGACERALLASPWELDVGETEHRSWSPHGSSGHFDSAAAGAHCHRSHSATAPAHCAQQPQSHGERSPLAPRATLLPVGPGHCRFQPCSRSRTSTETHGLARHELQLGQSPQPRLRGTEAAVTERMHAELGAVCPVEKEVTRAGARRGGCTNKRCHAEKEEILFLS